MAVLPPSADRLTPHASTPPSYIELEPSSLELRFNLELNVPASQSLRIRNTSATTSVTYKIKTTNPKRYSVRPNVGTVAPSSDVSIAIQLPPLKAPVPADLARSKDKFQVLLLPLSAEQQLAAQDDRNALNDVWASDSARHAWVYKVRSTLCVDDSSLRAATILEEGPAADTPVGFSPENPEKDASEPPCATPFVSVAESAATPEAMRAHDGQLEEVRAQLAEAMRCGTALRVQLQAEREDHSRQVQELKVEVASLGAQLEAAMAAADAAKASAAAAPAGGSVPYARSLVIALLAALVGALGSAALGIPAFGLSASEGSLPGDETGEAAVEGGW